MTEETYFSQMMRLSEAFGPKHYTKPRLTLIAKEVKGIVDHVFERAVNRLIMTSRNAPLLMEIKAACDAVVAEDKQRARERAPTVGMGLSNGSMAEQLRIASRRTGADPEFVQACLKTLTDFLNRKISRKQFDQACGVLDAAAIEFRTGGNSAKSTKSTLMEIVGV